MLVDGRLGAYIERGGRSILVPGGDDVLDAVAIEVTRLAAAQRRKMTIQSIDGVAAAQTPLGTALLAGSFVTGYRGITYRPPSQTPARRGR